MANSEIRAPLPGVYYRRPSPEEPNYKEVGDKVSKGDVVGLIEVMKTFTPVTSEFDGIVVEFQVETDDPVMAGQVLVILEG